MAYIKSGLYPKIVLFVLFLAVLLTAFYIIKPFLNVLITGATISYLSYPLYKKTLKYIKNKSFASLIVTLFIVLLLAIPFIVVLGLVSKEAYATYTTLNRQNLGTNFLKIVCSDENWLSCKAVKLFVGFLPENDLNFYLQVIIKKITGFLIGNIPIFLASVPLIILDFFVMMFMVYYLLKDGESIAKRIKNVIPLKEPHKHYILEKFQNSTYAVFYGNILIAVIQGIFGVLGFLMLGVSSPILWGFVMMLFAFIPYVGTAIIWLPAALNLIFVGYLQNDNLSTIRGIVLIIYGIFVISSIDNFLKPKLISIKAKIHPILVLLGVLGGLSTFGFIGLIIGPVALALLTTFMEIYKEENVEI